MAKSSDGKKVRQAESDDVVSFRALLESVTEATLLKKNDVKSVIEATLAALQKGMLAEKPVALASWGKIITKRVKAGTDQEKLVHRIVLKKDRP